MSDYYQQQVTMYMMRRKKRQAALSADTAAAEPDVERRSVNGGWLQRLAAFFTRERDEQPFASKTGRKRTGLAG